MKKINPKLYGLHSRIVLRKNKKNIYLVIDRNSRIIMKDGHRILKIVKKIRDFEKEKNFIVLSGATVCSKTQKFLTENKITIKSL